MELDFILNLIEENGYIGLFLWLWFGIFGVPIPNEVIIMTVGLAASQGVLNPFLTFFVVYMVSSTGFSKRVMSLAQESKNNEVKELIKTTGITHVPDIDFNPDGIFFDFSASVGGTECCHLIIKLRWM